MEEDLEDTWKGKEKNSRLPNSSTSRFADILSVSAEETPQSGFCDSCLARMDQRRSKFGCKTQIVRRC